MTAWVFIPLIIPSIVPWYKGLGGGVLPEAPGGGGQSFRYKPDSKEFERYHVRERKYVGGIGELEEVLQIIWERRRARLRY